MTNHNTEAGVLSRGKSLAQDKRDSRRVEGTR